MDWKPYLKDRLMARHPGGFVVIKPTEAALTIPLACPVCDHLLRSSDDEAHYAQFSCCERCANQWAYRNKTAWQEGWRPPEGEVASDIESRPRLALRFVID
jgi:hypothetical protein